MKPMKIFTLIGLLSCCLSCDLNAQQVINKVQTMHAKQQSIIAIAALTTKGDLPQLQRELNTGLDSGLTINEIKEVMVHLTAYNGFPRSLQGLNTFIAVLEERKAKGIKDKLGREATPVKNTTGKYEQGKRVLETLTGQAEREPKTGYAAFAPVIDTFLKEHLFADIFGRDVLTYTEREFATLSALITLGGVEPMMRGHMNIVMHLGVTEAELQQMLSLLEAKLGKAAADAGRRVLSTVKSTAVQPGSRVTSGNDGLFAKGVQAPANNFTGTAWVNMVVQAQDGLNCSIGTVTFEPGARTAWHRHPGGQILLVTEGVGYYQEKGQPIRIMQKGDVMKCLPGTEHWHGASPDSQVSHIAIGPNTDKGGAVWLQKVTDSEYKSYKKQDKYADH
ncbi:(R)-mandelonitrile lyase [Paracnuella aquatica]|uniref:(R)-mandelonitrile lyase n=1 Tax=Paracnuella aquatica TaxID=2268757 RepID=UPI000DEEDFD2|nr:carboxymuconolactone decarboxylase family protein [Paracnuella aquatica]RPD47248.1 cupin domain-containing protein [Paracnuella aquatica]